MIKDTSLQTGESPSLRQEIEDYVHELPENNPSIDRKLLMHKRSSQNERGHSSKYSSSISIEQFREYNTYDRYEVSEDGDMVIPRESQSSQMEVSDSSSTHNINFMKLNMSPKKLTIGQNKPEQVAKKNLTVTKDLISRCSSLKSEDSNYNSSTKRRYRYSTRQ